MRPKLTFNDSIWNAYELKDIVSFSKGKNVSLDIVTETGFPAMMYGDIYIKYDTFFNKVDYCIPIELSKDSTIIDKNTILMTCTGETAIDIGKSVCYLGETPICIGGDILALKCTDNTDAKFLCLQLNTYDKIKERARLSQGHSVVHLYQHHIEKSKIYKPDIATQTKIATFLNLYYKKIELQRNKVKKFINFKHHVIKSVINNKGDKYQLCELCQINKGQQLNKLNMLECRQYKVYNGGISYSGYTNKFNTNENTISISEGGNSCGFVNFINEKFWSGGHNYTLSNLKINTKYLYFILKSCQEDIMKLRVGSGLPNIQKSALEKFQVFIEKNNLSINLCLFELLEKKNVLEQQKLELLEKYKQGLLQKMFI